jgi:hypothetical protein
MLQRPKQRTVHVLWYIGHNLSDRPAAAYLPPVAFLRRKLPATVCGIPTLRTSEQPKYAWSILCAATTTP